MAGVLAGIKLKSTNRGGDDDSATANVTPPPPPMPPSMAAGRAPLAPLASLLVGANDSRKDVSVYASKKMKQLQWEKVPRPRLNKTIWSTPEVQEEELLTKMRSVNLWDEMENEFKAKEVIFDAVKKRKETELLSVLASDHRKRIEILMAGSTAKSFKDPERLSEAIANFDSTLCTETFLRELQGVLPNDDDRGKLLTHSADSEAELEALHAADRLMVRLIQLPHLADRVKGMLFRVRFDQNVELLKSVSGIAFFVGSLGKTLTMLQSLGLLTKACTDLLGAKCFRELLNVILVMGNYLNGTNYAGGAFGFKVASINRVRHIASISTGRAVTELTFTAGGHQIIQWPKSPPFPRTRRLYPFPPPRVLSRRARSTVPSQSSQFQRYAIHFQIDAGRNSQYPQIPRCQFLHC